MDVLTDDAHLTPRDEWDGRTGFNGGPSPLTMFKHGWPVHILILFLYRHLRADTRYSDVFGALLKLIMSSLASEGSRQPVNYRAAPSISQKTTHLHLHVLHLHLHRPAQSPLSEGRGGTDGRSPPKRGSWEPGTLLLFPGPRGPAIKELSLFSGLHTLYRDTIIRRQKKKKKKKRERGSCHIRPGFVLLFTTVHSRS